MPTAQVLRDRRDRARDRESHVEKLIRERKIDLNQLAVEIEEERQERQDLSDRRRDLRKAIEQEIADDDDGTGQHDPGWEQWAEARRDEIADLIDASEGRSNRLILTVADTRAKRNELRRLDRKLEKRIDRLEDRIARKANTSGQLTPHFHVVEFDCHDGTPVPVASIPALKAHCEIYLEPLRAAAGPVHVNSGFRTLAYNASIGGASLSVHVYDGPWQHSPWACAVDHVAGGWAPSAVQSWHESHTHPDGLGRYSSFTHVDNRNRLGWADARWVGP